MGKDKDVLSQFNKTELLNIAVELDLDTMPANRVEVMLEAIKEDLDENGIPEVDDCTDDMFEFLYVAEYIDKDGDIIEDDDTEEESDEDIKLPACFGFADERDPACNQCKVYKTCVTERKAQRPKCYGKMFDKNAEECKYCIDAPACRLQIAKEQ